MVKQYDFSVEKRVTQTYLRYRHAHKAIRELRCMEQMYPDIFLDILPGDLFAGRIKMSHIGFSPEPGGLGYYCDAPAIREILPDGSRRSGVEAGMREVKDMLSADGGRDAVGRAAESCWRTVMEGDVTGK